jgi:hypothetical protein
MLHRRPGFAYSLFWPAGRLQKNRCSLRNGVNEGLVFTCAPTAITFPGFVWS